MGTSRKILVIEDDQQIRETLVLFLEAEGYEAVAASDGVEGLAILQAHPDAYALVILDFFMPRMTGAEVIVELRNHATFARIPVILMTAAISTQVIPIQPTMTLAKPLDIDLLLETVATHCAGSEQAIQTSSIKIS